ncbi:hypothetical protein DIPPA_05182 [Diplonema papillatum]|nr:hypothetical protein DIPPA_05182 [Diplonema papillatum]
MEKKLRCSSMSEGREETWLVTNGEWVLPVQEPSPTHRTVVSSPGVNPAARPLDATPEFPTPAVRLSYHSLSPSPQRREDATPALPRRLGGESESTEQPAAASQATTSADTVETECMRAPTPVLPQRSDSLPESSWRGASASDGLSDGLAAEHTRRRLSDASADTRGGAAKWRTVFPAGAGKTAAEWDREREMLRRQAEEARIEKANALRKERKARGSLELTKRLRRDDTTQMKRTVSQLANEIAGLRRELHDKDKVLSETGLQQKLVEDEVIRLRHEYWDWKYAVGETRINHDDNPLRYERALNSSAPEKWPSLEHGLGTLPLSGSPASHRGKSPPPFSTSRQASTTTRSLRQSRSPSQHDEPTPRTSLPRPYAGESSGFGNHHSNTERAADDRAKDQHPMPQGTRDAPEHSIDDLRQTVPQAALAACSASRAGSLGPKVLADSERAAPAPSSRSSSRSRWLEARQADPSLPPADCQPENGCTETLASSQGPLPSAADAQPCAEFPSEAGQHRPQHGAAGGFRMNWRSAAAPSPRASEDPNTTSTTASHSDAPDPEWQPAAGVASVSVMPAHGAPPGTSGTPRQADPLPALRLVEMRGMSVTTVATVATVATVSYLDPEGQPKAGVASGSVVSAPGATPGTPRRADPSPMRGRAGVEPPPGALPGVEASASRGEHVRVTRCDAGFEGPGLFAGVAEPAATLQHAEQAAARDTGAFWKPGAAGWEQPATVTAAAVDRPAPAPAGGQADLGGEDGGLASHRSPVLEAAAVPRYPTCTVPTVGGTASPAADPSVDRWVHGTRAFSASSAPPVPYATTILPHAASDPDPVLDPDHQMHSHQLQAVAFKPTGTSFHVPDAVLSSDAAAQGFRVHGGLTATDRHSGVGDTHQVDTNQPQSKLGAVSQVADGTLRSDVAAQDLRAQVGLTTTLSLPGADGRVHTNQPHFKLGAASQVAGGTLHSDAAAQGQRAQGGLTATHSHPGADDQVHTNQPQFKLGAASQVAGGTLHSDAAAQGQRAQGGLTATHSHPGADDQVHTNQPQFKLAADAAFHSEPGHPGIQAAAPSQVQQPGPAAFRRPPPAERWLPAAAPPLQAQSAGSCDGEHAAHAYPPPPASTSAQARRGQDEAVRRYGENSGHSVAFDPGIHTFQGEEEGAPQLSSRDRGTPGAHSALSSPQPTALQRLAAQASESSLMSTGGAEGRLAHRRNEDEYPHFSPEFPPERNHRYAPSQEPPRQPARADACRVEPVVPRLALRSIVSEDCQTTTETASQGTARQLSFVEADTGYPEAWRSRISPRAPESPGAARSTSSGLHADDDRHTDYGAEPPRNRQSNPKDPHAREPSSSTGYQTVAPSSWVSNTSGSRQSSAQRPADPGLPCSKMVFRQQQPGPNWEPAPLPTTTCRCCGDRSFADSETRTSVVDVVAFDSHRACHHKGCERLPQSMSPRGSTASTSQLADGGLLTVEAMPGRTPPARAPPPGFGARGGYPVLVPFSVNPPRKPSTHRYHRVSSRPLVGVTSGGAYREAIKGKLDPACPSFQLLPRY